MDNNCPHCVRTSFAFKHPLSDTKNFLVVCDVHPLVEGHILIIPKEHISCVGEYPSELMWEFNSLYEKVSNFVKKTYGAVASFEHGVIGQTVFHSHVHFLPFKGSVKDIVPEGENRLKKLLSIFDLKEIFESEKGYLFFSIEDKMYTVDQILGQPRFFRDRFAKAVGKPERGNWKTMMNDKAIMAVAEDEMKQLISKWNSFA